MAGKLEIQSHATGEKQTVTQEQWDQMQSIKFLKGKHFITKGDTTPPEIQKAADKPAVPVDAEPRTGNSKTKTTEG